VAKSQKGGVKHETVVERPWLQRTVREEAGGLNCVTMCLQTRVHTRVLPLPPPPEDAAMLFFSYFKTLVGKQVFLPNAADGSDILPETRESS
jgi:hypothetical protein